MVAPPVAWRRAPRARPGDRTGNQPGLEQPPPARPARFRGSAAIGRCIAAAAWGDLLVAHGALLARGRCQPPQRARPRGRAEDRKMNGGMRGGIRAETRGGAPGLRRNPDGWEFLTAGNAAPFGGCLLVLARAHRARGRLEAKCDTRDGSNSDGFW